MATAATAEGNEGSSNAGFKACLMPPLSRSQINNIPDFTLRTILLSMYDQFDLHNQVTGTNWIQPTNSPQKPAAAVPAQGSLSVSGENGIFSIVATNPKESVNKTLYIEVSHSPQIGGSYTALPIATATRQNLPSPGVTVFFRARWSYDQNNWSGYYTIPSAVSSGLQSSAATENANVLNQTNYANVDSVSNIAGDSANVRIYGKAGVATQFPAVKGAVEEILPSATVINVPFASSQLVGYDGKDYAVRGTLPEILADGYRPIGAVSVVGSGARVLPVVTVTIGGGGGIASWNVVSGGNALSDAVTLTPPPQVGAGGSPGAQTITTGVLISIANGNPGVGGTPGTYPVGVSGGISAGLAGGGQSIGGNNGRLVYADPTTGAL